MSRRLTLPITGAAASYVTRAVRRQLQDVQNTHVRTILTFVCEADGPAHDSCSTCLAVIRCPASASVRSPIFLPLGVRFFVPQAGCA